MKIFRKALLIIIVLSAAVFACAGFTVKATGLVFPDLTEDKIFYPYIQKLFQEHFVSGDTRTGTFRPGDTINRAEFAKITAYTRLAEEYGVKDYWSGKDALGMAFEIFDLLKPYFGCWQGACESIGGAPFTDVRESDPKCMDDIGNPDACEPWFSRYVYYAVSKGYIKGYANPDGTRSFRPTENILRVHALKMMIVDNGNILPENDSRYQRLIKQAVSLGAYSPKCLKGAENYIKDLNGGNTADAEKLLKYALLADRLDLFGNRCEVFGSYRTPVERALFLQRPLTRGETPRYFAITTAYSPVRPETADTTINTAAENSNSPAGVPSYKMPVYEKTPLYNRQGGDESVWGDNGDTGAPAPELPPMQIPVSPPASKRPVYDSDAPYIPLTDSARPPENAAKAIAKTGQEAVLPEKGLPSAVITASTDIALTGEYGEPCGSIPAGEKFSLLIARKGEDGEFYQYTDYDPDRSCRFPCDKLMTPACRYAVAEDNVLNPSQGNTVVRREEVATPDISTYFRLIKMPVQNVCNVCTDTVNKVKDIKENPAKYVKMIEDKTKAASMADGSYDIADISPAWIKAENPGTQTFTVRVKNISGKVWKQDNTFLTPDIIWLAARNYERHSRGFSQSEDVPSLRLTDTKFKFTEKNVQPEETATFIISVPPNQPARAQIRLTLNGKSASNIDAIYLTAVKEEERGFRTSTDSAWFQKFPILNMGKVKNKRGELEDKPLAPYWSEITTSDTPVTVLGHAVIGEYVDTFKTYMWYPAEYNGDRGFVVASSVHAEMINGQEMDTHLGTQLWSKSYKERPNKKVNETSVLKGIVLHTTGGSAWIRQKDGSFILKKAKAEKDTYVNTTIVAHYYLDRGGGVAQIIPDFKKSDHAAEFTINDQSIGIEMMNTATAVKDKSGIYKGALGSIVPDSDVINVKNQRSKFWDIWTNSINQVASGLNTSWGVASAKEIEEWQTFSPEQYKGLAELIKYINERYDIPVKYFFRSPVSYKAARMDKENNYILDKNGKKIIDEININTVKENGILFFPRADLYDKEYLNQLYDFYGIYGHHNASGKYDPGPAFDINSLNTYLK